MNTPTKPTFHAHGKDWFPHTLGDPMSCEPDDLARDLERELNIALAERDAAREDAERLADALRTFNEVGRCPAFIAEKDAAIAAHEAIAKN